MARIHWIALASIRLEVSFSRFGSIDRLVDEVSPPASSRLPNITSRAKLTRVKRRKEKAASLLEFDGRANARCQTLPSTPFCPIFFPSDDFSPARVISRKRNSSLPLEKFSRINFNDEGGQTGRGSRFMRSRRLTRRRRRRQAS